MREECSSEFCCNLRKPNGYKKSGARKYYKLCSPCLKNRYGEKVYTPYEGRAKQVFRTDGGMPKYGGYIKKLHCEHCSFVALNKCQLDVDHIDGDHNNNERSNLQTLCANCHRLKTWTNKDWKSR